jgi:hypothetical protein
MTVSAGDKLLNGTEWQQKRAAANKDHCAVRMVQQAENRAACSITDIETISIPRMNLRESVNTRSRTANRI